MTHLVLTSDPAEAAVSYSHVCQLLTRLTRRSSGVGAKPASADSDSQLPDPRPCPDQKQLQIRFGTLRPALWALLPPVVQAHPDGPCPSGSGRRDVPNTRGSPSRFGMLVGWMPVSSSRDICEDLIVATTLNMPSTKAPRTTRPAETVAALTIVSTPNPYRVDRLLIAYPENPELNFSIGRVGSQN